MPSALSDLEILQSQSLSKAVQDEILRLILEGAFEAGQKLNELDIAKRLGVSRGPVREAFRGLEEAKLLRLTKNRGVYVREITPQEEEELCALRAGLDSLAGQMLAPRVQDAGIRELLGLVDDMAGLIAGGDLRGYLTCNSRFHDRIVEMAGNRKLLEIYRRLVNEMHLVRRDGIALDNGSLQSNQEHRELVEALAVGDAQKSADTARKHVLNVRQRFLAARPAAPGGNGGDRGS